MILKLLRTQSYSLFKNKFFSVHKPSPTAEDIHVGHPSQRATHLSKNFLSYPEYFPRFVLHISCVQGLNWLVVRCDVHLWLKVCVIGIIYIMFMRLYFDTASRNIMFIERQRLCSDKN